MIAPANRRAILYGPDDRPLALGGGYDGGKTSERRKAVSTLLGSEDHVQTATERKRLVGNTRDLRRNHADAAWSIRKHLDYVATFRFQARTDDEGLNRELEAFVAWASEADRFDAAGKHSRQSFTRLAEAARTCDGDLLVLKMNDGSVKAIEGDRVRKPMGRLPRGFKADQFTHGVKSDLRGRATHYAIHDRQGGVFVFRAIMAARLFWHLAYFDRFDQLRGVSPLASALNLHRDQYEARELALAKFKVEQLFALVFSRNAEEAPGELTGGTDTDDDGEADSAAGYDVDMGKGPVQLDLDPGDKAEFLNSETPGGHAIEFMTFVVSIAMKALDIPYSFFDSSKTNFYGGRADVMQYVKSASAKQLGNQSFLSGWFRWRLAVAIRDRDFDLGRRNINELKFDWVPPAVPLWDIAKEARGLGMMASMHLFNLEGLASEYGTGDIYENIRANSRVAKAAEKAGLPLVLPGSSAFVPESDPIGANSNE